MKKLLGILLASFLLVGCSQADTTSDVADVATTEATTTAVINVYTRDAASGTREAFEKAIDLDDGELTANASEVSSNGDMAAKVGADENGIGYVSLTTDFAANNVTPLNFENVAPSVETVLDGSYTMQRPFNLVTRADGDYESDDMQQLVEAFIAYITESEEGLSVVESKGGIVDYSNAQSWDEIAANYPVLQQDNSALTIRTGGSTSVEKVINAALTEFSSLAGNVQFAMDQTGSGDGYKRVLGEEKDGVNAKEIGFASRPFGDEEDVSTALVATAFCQDAVVVIVNAASSLENISQADVNAIYQGDITDFSEVK